MLTFIGYLAIGKEAALKRQILTGMWNYRIRSAWRGWQAGIEFSNSRACVKNLLTILIFRFCQTDLS
jgi:hypothetical protein